MVSNSEAKAILRPIFDAYNKALEDHQVDKAAGYYLPDAVLIHKGKSCCYGREEIKKELMKFDEMMGKATTKLIDDTYQMTPEYIIISAGYQTTSEKIGTVSGKFTQIWKKSGNSYLIYHDEFDMN
ncbi:DUF4440 domain-containing protein [Trichostrongylus colubriformis]|uniref:DUF4440 domain-containing protein n=1 Tax=Trichostrongylus colubriformis TaxID=6319 RepID=A0AAN8EMZ3_TRICO